MAKRRKGLILVAFGLLILISIVLSLTVPVRVKVRGNGFVVGAKLVEIRTPDDGQLKDIFVEEGSWVKEGQLLAAFDDTIDESNVKKVQAEVKVIQAEIDRLKAEGILKVKMTKELLIQAKTALENAKMNYNRAKTLKEKGFVPAASEDSAKLELDIAKSKYEAALLPTEDVLEKERKVLEEKLKLALLTLEGARIGREEKKMISPISGVVEWHEARRGEFVPKNKVIGSIFDNRSFSVKARIKEKDLRRICLGQEARVQFLAYPKLRYQSFEGKVSEISPLVNPGKDGSIGSLEVYISLAPTNHELKPGLNAEVEILAGKSTLLPYLLGIDTPSPGS